MVTNSQLLDWIPKQGNELKCLADTNCFNQTFAMWYRHLRKIVTLRFKVRGHEIMCVYANFVCEIFSTILLSHLNMLDFVMFRARSFEQCTWCTVLSVHTKPMAIHWNSIKGTLLLTLVLVSKDSMCFIDTAKTPPVSVMKLSFLNSRLFPIRYPIVLNKSNIIG